MKLIKWNHEGKLHTQITMIIPFLLYVSQSWIVSEGRSTVGRVFALHITPWFTIGVNGVKR